MKIEMLESLGSSYLRHVIGCWMVQTNWKASPRWKLAMSPEELESLYESMRSRFGVFKRTSSAKQFLRQAEIDVFGVDFGGNVHAVETAFHEGGLDYGDTRDRVLKKLLRTQLTLSAFEYFGGQAHVWFVSPKVRSRDVEALEQVFDAVREAYSELSWHLCLNDRFRTEILGPTVEAAANASDTSELFLRAVRLAGWMPRRETPGVAARGSPEAIEKLQPLVRSLMRSLLECPTVLAAECLRDLQSAQYCKSTLNLALNYPLLRVKKEGRKGPDGRNRYWKDLYGGEYYVCQEWPKEHHLENAKALLVFVDDLMAAVDQRGAVKAMSIIAEHRAAICSYVRRNAGLIP